jgi:hypothetical protein
MEVLHYTLELHTRIFAITVFRAGPQRESGMCRNLKKLLNRALIHIPYIRGPPWGQLCTVRTSTHTFPWKRGRDTVKHIATTEVCVTLGTAIISLFRKEEK